jgi:phage terminase Nu1 subunit (DNA packaging protein)
MYILVGMLIVGLICNLMVRPLADKWFMTDAELAEEKRLAHEKMAASEVGAATSTNDSVPTWVVAFAWTAVGLPLAWGIYRTLLSVAKFFA